MQSHPASGQRTIRQLLRVAHLLSFWINSARRSYRLAHSLHQARTFHPGPGTRDLDI